MISVFREKSSFSVFWLLLLSVVLHSHFFIFPPHVVVPDADSWMKELLTPLSSLPSVFLVLLYHAIIIVQSLRLSAVLNNLRMFPRLYFIPALSYLLLTALLPEWSNITPALLFNFVIIWLFALLARLYSSPRSRPMIYNAGFLTGVCVIVYPPCLFLIPTAFIALALLRAFRFNEWIILLFGILTPPYLLASLLFLNDSLASFLSILPQFAPHLLTGNQIPLLITTIAGGSLLVAGIFSWQANTGRMIIHTRRCWSVLFLMFLLSIPLLFVLKGETVSMLMLGMIPAAALASNTFVYSKNELLQNILFWVFVVVIMFNNWYWL